jgi:hypothetical protein
LIASANDLINAFRYHIVSINTKHKLGTPIKSANQSLTDFLDRLITGHLIQHPEEADKLLQDPAVVDINYFGRNPDMDPTNAATRLHNHMPITPIKVGSGAGSAVVSNKKATWREINSEARVGSAGPISGGARVGSAGPISGGGAVSEEEDYITVETTKLTTPMTNWGGKKEAQVSRGFIELRDAGKPIRIFLDDFKWFTYWIRHGPERDHMEVTLRAACKIAEKTNQKSKFDKLMYMGSQWKMHPNLATWHDSLEEESSEH